MSKFLKKGDVIELKLGHTVYTDLPESLVFSNCRSSKEFTHHDIKIDGAFLYLAGKYAVIETKMDGGGTGMGARDIFPDGHHVFCQSLEDPELKVDFYQSGAFTAMITDIVPVGKASKKEIWTVSC